MGVAKACPSPEYGSLSEETRQRLLSEGAEAWQIDSYEQTRPWWACSSQAIKNQLHLAKAMTRKLAWRKRLARKKYLAPATPEVSYVA